MWVCSLLVIPPPIGRMVPQGGFPTDLTELNLLGWADLVQDMVAGLQALPPRLSLDLGSQVVALLQLLEAATGVGFCCHCCHPRPHCMCTGASQPAPPMSWSQIFQQAPGYGVTSSGGGVTDPSTSMGGMPGYMTPPPGLTLPDFSIWSIPPQEAHLPPGLPVSPLYQPPMGRASSLRATIDRQAQALRATALQAPTSQAPLPQAPQMAPPLHQPLPSSGSQPATPYQQAVQPLSKPKGRGVTLDSSADKLVAVGGQDADGRGRQRTQGRDDNTWPASPAKGVRERSSIRMTGKQMPCQVSECPSGAPCEAPIDSTPGSTSCQRGSSMSAPKDPLKRVAHYRSQGWRKDLDLIFKAYYKYNFSSFKESEWSKIRDKVLDHLLPCQEEWRSIKENNPLQYMPYMEEQFYAATGIRLKGLAECTIWIKQGSYYHSVVAQKGKVHKCAHLVGIELPRGPQITPSESHWASQRKAEAPVASSSVPIIEASTPQGATSDVPAPMETGGAGDGQSWVEQTEAEDDFKRRRPAKHPRSQSRRWEDRPTFPFPLQDEEGRRTSTQELYRHSGQQPPAHHNVTTMGITHLHPEVLPCEARSLGNQVLCMIAEYHLTSHAQGSSSLCPVLPEVARDLLPPIENYVGGGAFHGTRDMRVVERAKTLQIATWLHRLDMVAEGDQIASQTLEATRHRRGPLLDLLLAPMMGSLTFVEVVDHVLDKNQRREESSLAELHGCRTQI